MKKYLPLLFIAILTYGCKKDGLSKADRLLIGSETATVYYSADSTLNFTAIMEYNSDNTLKSASYNYGPQYYVNIDDYTYDGNGNLTQLAFNEGTIPNGVDTYEYQNGIPVSTAFTPPGSTTAVVEAEYTLKDGKVQNTLYPQFSNETEVISYNGNNYNTFTYNDGTVVTFTYGTHHSQFLYTGYKYCIYGLDYIVNDNEILEKKTVYTNGEVYDQKNSYTYNSQGYPLKETSYVNGELSEVCTYGYTQAN